MVDLGPKFYHKLLEIANEVQMPPEFLLTVMNMESGLNPHIGGNGKALGLVQILPKYLKNVGWKGTEEEFRMQPAYQQLNYVRNLIKGNMRLNGGKPFKSVTQYYVSNFLPLALKLPGVQNEEPNTPIVRKNPVQTDLPWSNSPRHLALEKSFYAGNSGLDEDRNDIITYGDLQKMMAKKGNPNNSTFQKALSDLKKYTDYTGNKSKMLSNLSKSEFSKYIERLKKTDIYNKSDETLEQSISPGLDSILNRFLKYVISEDKLNKRLYKKALPKHEFLIQVYTSDEVNAIEFSRILCTALDEELFARACTHTDGMFVEINGDIHGPKLECMVAVTEVAKSVAKAFNLATIKIGGIKVVTKVTPNKKSLLKLMNINIAETNYRKFLLKIT